MAASRSAFAASAYLSKYRYSRFSLAMRLCLSLHRSTVIPITKVAIIGSTMAKIYSVWSLSSGMFLDGKELHSSLSLIVRDVEVAGMLKSMAPRLECNTSISEDCRLRAQDRSKELSTGSTKSFASDVSKARLMVTSRPSLPTSTK